MTFAVDEHEGGAARVAWVDYAKGICIVAVVCMYATYYMQHHHGTGWMQYWVDFARPFRMPDFFLVSGLFLARTIDRPWRDYLDKKVVHFVYFFALWTTIYFVAEALLTENVHDKHPLWVEYLRWYIEPYRMLWFIAMLPVYFLVTRFVRHVPWWIVLPLAAGLQVADPEIGWEQGHRFGERYVYFYAGYAFAPLVFRVADWTRQNRGKALALLALWAAINESVVLTGLHERAGYSLVLGFAGATAVVAVASLLQASRWMDWLRYLGQNSIIVFLSFYLPMVAAAKLVWRIGLPIDTGTQALLVAIFAIAAPMAVQHLGKRTLLRFLFERLSWAGVRRRDHFVGQWSASGKACGRPDLTRTR